MSHYLLTGRILLQEASLVNSIVATAVAVLSLKVEDARSAEAEVEAEGTGAD